MIMENTCNTCHIQQNGCLCDAILDVPCCGKVRCNPCWDTCTCMEEILKLLKCGTDVKQSITDISERIDGIEQLIQNHYNYFINAIDDLSQRVTRIELDLTAVWRAIHDLQDTTADHSRRILNIEDVELPKKIGYAEYNSVTKRIIFYENNTKTNPLCDIDANRFVIDGMVDDVRVSGNNLEIIFNTDSGKSPIYIPLSSIFDPAAYVTELDTNGDNIRWKKNNQWNTLTAPYATKALQDKDGNQIDTTYLKDIPNGVLTGLTVSGNTLTFSVKGGSPIVVVLPTVPASLWVDDPTNNTLKPATNGRTVTSAGFYDTSINAPAS